MIANNTTFDIVMKLASKACLDADIVEFDELDISDIIIHPKTWRKIERALKKEMLKNSVGYDVLKHIAVACLVVCTLLFTTAMCIEPVRAEFWNAIVTWYEDCFGILFEQEEADVPEIIENSVLPSDLPEGWLIETLSETPALNVYNIYGTQGEFVLYRQMVGKDREIWLNNEECTIERIMLNNKDEAFLCVYPENQITLVWNNCYTFFLSGEQVDRDTLITIAKSIKP